MPSAPDPPAQTAASADSVTLCWRPPADNGAPISGYTLEVDDGRGGDFRLAYSGGGTAASVGGLAAGLPYRFRLNADNMVRWGQRELTGTVGGGCQVLLLGPLLLSVSSKKRSR